MPIMSKRQTLSGASNHRMVTILQTAGGPLKGQLQLENGLHSTYYALYAGAG